MIKRKLGEIGSGLYRTLIYPFVRMRIEKRTKSIMKQGSYLNKGSVLLGRNYIGKNTVLSNTKVGFGSYVNNGCDLSNTEIGRYTSIGAGVTTNLGSHPVDGKHAALHPAFYSRAGALGYTYVNKDTYEEMKYIHDGVSLQVSIGNDVWIGNSVMIMEGVTIGDGAVIGSGAVVTQDVEPYGVYAGVPAKKLRSRFSEEQIKNLLYDPWWFKSEEWIKNKASLGIFDDVDELIEALK